jgi:hypothetical protein
MPAGRKIITHYTWGSQPINTRFDRTHTVAGKSHPNSPNPNGHISSHYRYSGISRLMRAAHDVKNSSPGASATWLHAIAAPRLARLRAPGP